LSAASPARGPRLENGASASLSSIAPTVSAASALPGEPTVRSAPALPAETTNSAPNSAVRSCTACSIGSTSGVSASPRLMLTTSACWSATAHRMPSMMAESGQPNRSHTLAAITVASGATPLYRPTPLPAMVAATCVPCPTWSRSSLPSTNVRCALTRPARSGCVLSTPESTTATRTPAPVYPAAHAAGAPIWGTLTSSATRRTPSSQIFGASGREPAARIARHSDPRLVRSALATTPRPAGRSRTVVAPAGTAGLALRLAPARPVAGLLATISGRSARRSSSYPYDSNAVTSNSRLSSVPARNRGTASAGTTCR
jgi:hypothetical protein